jgi:hypothetical protein
VRDGSGLSGSSCGGSRSRSAHVTRSAASDEAAADLVGHGKLATCKGARPGDGIARTAVLWRFGFEQRQHTFCAVRSPRGDDPTLGFGQCLRRTHT